MQKPDVNRGIAVRPHFAPGSSATVWLAVAERVFAVARQLRRALAAAGRGADLNEIELITLWACSVAPPEGMGQTQLIARLGVSPAQVSGLVESLRRRGLLSAKRDPLDRRRQRWQLTEQGQALLELAAEHLVRQIAQGRPAGDSALPTPHIVEGFWPPELLIDELDRVSALFPAAEFLPGGPSHVGEPMGERVKPHTLAVQQCNPAEKASCSDIPPRPRGVGVRCATGGPDETQLAIDLPDRATETNSLDQQWRGAA